MVAPSLSRIERERLAAAAKLAASGVKIRWDARGRKLRYIAGGKEHEVFALSTSQRGFESLCRQAEAEFRQLGGLANVNECSSAA